ncbi:MAG: hypothetical protein IJA10_01245 [Lachnospiraceae bacterium]|nr:hypothetical protein [Lachnospiraceae bacterium]
MEKKEYVVGNYVFQSMEQARLAEKEKKMIELLVQKTDFNNKDTVKSVYDNLVQKQLLKTPIGYDFMNQLRKVLLEDYHMPQEDVTFIPVSIPMKTNSKTILEDETLKDKLKKMTNQKNTFVILTTLLTCLVIGMFMIIAFSDNVGYINTENKILDKYCKWEEELKEKESELKEREEAIRQKEIEAALNQE